MLRFGHISPVFPSIYHGRVVSIIATVLALILLSTATPAQQITPANIVSPDGWAWHNPFPQGNDLNGVWGNLSATDIFAVGNSGTVIHYDGKTWSGTNVGANTLYAVWGSFLTSAMNLRPDDVYAVGANGAIIHYDGNGWTSMSSPTQKDLHGIWGSWPSDIYAVGAGGTILHYNGVAWSQVTSNTGLDLYAVWARSPSDAYAVGAGATILHYDGTVWTAATNLSSNETLVGVSGSLSTKDLVVVGAGGTVWQYDGTSWNSNSVNTYPFYGVWFDSAADAVAVGGGVVGRNPTIWRYDGSVWNDEYTGDQDLHAVWGSSSSSAVYAVGAAGTILYDNGSGWSLLSSDTAVWIGPADVPRFPDNFYAVWGSSSSNVMVAGFNPTGVDCAYFPQYNGSVWNWDPNSFCPSPGVYRGLWGSSATNVFEVGDVAIAAAQTEGLNGVWGSTSRNSSGSANDVFAVGVSGEILYFNGATWSQRTSHTTNSLTAVWGSSSLDVSGHANDVYAVGLSGTVIHDDGSGWQSMSSGIQTNLYGVWGSSSSDVYACGAGGAVLHYNGAAWTALNSNTTNDLRAVWGSSSADVFFVGANGTILHYDGAATWKSMNSGTQRNLNAVWGSSATDVFAVGDNGTILHYQPPNAPANPVPATTGISPSTLPYSLGTFTVTVNGNNFISGSVVRLNGTNLATTYLSATQLTAVISPTGSALLTAGITWAAKTFNITVFNPTPGGGTSNPQTLTVTPAATALSVPAVSGTYQGTVTLSAVLTAGGSAVPNKSVTFAINGISVGTPVTTDSSGTATLTVSLACSGEMWLTGLPPYPPCIHAGTYPAGIAASFAGDSNYPGRNGTAPLSLSKIPTQILLPSASFVTGQSVTLTATLTATTASGSNPIKVDEGQVVFQTPNGALTSTVFEGFAAVIFTPPPSAIGSFPIAATFSSIDFGTSSGTSTLSISSFTADLAITSLTIAPLVGASAPQGETVTVQAANLGPATAEGVTVALMLRDYKGNQLSTVATWVVGALAANTPVVESTTVDLTTVALGSQYYATVSSLYGVDNYPWNNSAILVLSALSFDLTNGANFSLVRNSLPFPNKNSQANVTWEQFETTFGYDNVDTYSCPARSSECAWVHSPKAQWFYDGLYSPWFQGNCYGMSAYALNEWIRLPGGGYEGTNYVFSQYTDYVWYQTEILQGTALGGQVLTQEAAESKLGPNTVLAALKAEMANRIGSVASGTTGASSNPIILLETTGTSNNPGALYAHAVVPYQILETQTITTNELNQVTMNEVVHIFVYDPNYPYDPKNVQQSLRFITIDPVKNTWTDSVTKMGGNTGLLYIPSSLNAEQPPALPYATNNSSTTPPTDVVITTGEASAVLDTIIDGVQYGIGVDLTPVSAVVDGVLTIVGWAENINGNSVATDVEDGLEVAADIAAIVIWFCLDPVSASGPPPEAYLLSAGHQYTATLYGTGTGSATLNMLKSAKGLQFTSQSMTPATQDSVTYSADGSTANLATNAATESYSATMLQDVSTSAEEATISNTTMAVGESITLAYLNSGASFQIKNQGGPKSYDLTLQLVGNGAGQASFTGLSIGSNETHLYTPSDWTNLNSAPVSLQIANSLGTTSGNLVAPAITSAGIASFTYGTGGTFTVTTTGFPQPLLTESGTLPSGVSVNGQTGVLSVAPSTPAGVYPITLTAVNSMGGSPAQKFSLTVNPAPLTIKADNQTISYGAPWPVLTASYSGFVNGDAGGVLNGTLSCSTMATASSPAGTYPITCSGQTSTNYLISYLPGQLSITPSSGNGSYALLVGSAGGTSSIVLASGGAWTATANSSFLHISNGSSSGTGSALVVFTYDAFPGTGSRTGTLTIAGLTVTVTQAGVNYLAPGPVITLVSSGLNQPLGLSVDASGNVYIADTNNNAIKQWNAATQQVTSLVPVGLNGPFGVAADGAGNVYIADTNNSAIKEWSAATQQVTALVSSGLSYPFGVAVDGAGNVYIGDTYNNAIEEWNATTQQLTTLVSSGLNSPRGVAVDGAGNVYIADDANSAIKQWNAATQKVTTLVSSGLAYPFGVAVNASGDVYIADYSKNAIKKWSASTQQVTTLVSSGLDDPNGVAVDGSGNVYIADSDNNAIKEMPYAFVGPASRTESPAAGSDLLLPVLPSTTPLTGIFAPTSDQNWLTIGPITNGVINFSFTANTSISRVAHITVLGQQISITQNGSAPQTITFGALADQPLATPPFTVTATASSGLPVILNSKTTSVCTVSGAQVTLLAVGTCTIEADQTGNADYAAATAITRSFQVTGNSCAIGHGGSTTIGDVQHIVNEALGVMPAIHDLNGDGMVSAVEVQIIINAALTFGCTTR